MNMESSVYYSADLGAIAAFGAVTYVITLVLCIFMLVCLWKILVKAGKPGWATIVPLYNVYTEFDLVYGNGWKFLLLLIPFVNFVIMIKYCLDFAKVFGKGTGFGLLLLFVPIVGFPMLAFGDAQYQGPLKK